MPPLRVPRHPNDLWAWAKQIDGYPDTEWTFPIFVARTATLGGLLPQNVYGYGSTWAHVVGLLDRANRLTRARVPPRFCDAVTLGVEWFESGFRAPGGRLTLPLEGETFRGRHSVSAVGLSDDRKAVLFRNSWGTDWGDDGFGLISQDYFDAHVDDIFVQRLSSVGPSPAMARKLLRGGRSPTSGAIARAWMTPNPEAVTDVLIADRRHSLARFTATSFDGDREVEVLELRTAYRPVARCHVFHRRTASPPSSYIEELFVLPTFRKREYGRHLLSVARAAARDAGSGTLSIMVYEADARPRSLPDALGFIDAVGYDWVETPGRRPNLVGRGSATTE